ncbi:MAG: GIY-YIG nuclease family protein [Patescibacteria group bacterium]|nr:GIY-YIG nuclease family protein [Patescibacteria group bacterium]
MIEKKDLKKIPATFGVYLFKNKEEVIYVGKSVNLKARILSHIESAKVNKKEAQIVKNSDSINYVITENDFQSLLLESELIKRYKPKYNFSWKDDKSYLYIKITNSEGYPRIFLIRKKDIGSDDQKKFIVFGPFSSVNVAEKLLREIRRIVPFCSENKISKRPCFYSKINLCNPCPNFIELQQDEKIKRYLKRQYRNNIKKIIKIFEGKVVEILDDFYKQLRSLIKDEKFEEAIKIREKIFRLERLINNPIKDEELSSMSQDQNRQSLLLRKLSVYFGSLKKLSRIECYDVSNLQQKSPAASMVVMANGILDKKEYRRFRIKHLASRSDFERIREVILRRFNQNWSEPDLIVIDGGRPQVRVVTETLAKIGKEIPVVGIAKNPDRLVIREKNNKFLTIKFPQTDMGFRLITLIRDEAHRFARRYHIKLREKDFLI